MKTGNPFEELDIKENPKSVFEACSHEANKIEQRQRIAILAKIVYAGYSLEDVVKNYLLSRDEKIMNPRKSQVEYTLKSCLDDILDSDFSVNSETLGLKFTIIFLESAIKKEYTEKKLLLSYVNDNKEQYKLYSYVLGVDFEDDILTKVLERDKEEETYGLWCYAGLYEWYKSSFLPDLRNNYISYYHPSFEMPSTGMVYALIKKYYPEEEHEKLKTDDSFRRERLQDLVEKIIRILWFNEPICDEPIYLVRCNYVGNVEVETDSLYEKNIVSICIQNNEKEAADREYYRALVNNENPKYIKNLPYIHRFVALQNLVKTTDVLVISSFAGRKTKLGLIKKGSDVYCIDRGEYKLYCMNMVSVYCTPTCSEKIESVDLRDYPILKSIIPQQVTISAVNKRKNAIYQIYYGVQYPISLSLMSDSAIEVMCAEWLRSEYVEPEYRIAYQLMRTGGNFGDVDVLGVNREGMLVGVQVSYTDDINLISKKIDKLNAFNADYRVMFSMKNRVDLEFIDGCKNIFIGDVWNKFQADPFYKKMLERLVKL